MSYPGHCNKSIYLYQPFSPVLYSGVTGIWLPDLCMDVLTETGVYDDITQLIIESKYCLPSIVGPSKQSTFMFHSSQHATNINRLGPGALTWIMK